MINVDQKSSEVNRLKTLRIVVCREHTQLAALLCISVVYKQILKRGDVICDSVVFKGMGFFSICKEKLRLFNSLEHMAYCN